MWLDELVELARTLRRRIEAHGDLLQANEMRTRYALVDPVLTALGWNIHDPDQVVPEYSAGTGRADYALGGGAGETPDVLIEAKKLGTPLDDKLGQAITYCNERGIKHFAVTDGARWMVYETFKPVPNPQKLITEFSVDSSAKEFVFKLMWLWRGNFVSGQPFSAPPRLVARQTSEAEGGREEATELHKRATEPVVVPSHVGAQPQQRPPSVPVPTDEWLPLTDVELRVRGETGLRGKTPPGRIRFPDKDERALGRWSDILKRVADWLVQTRRLTADRCPVTGRGGGTYVASGARRPAGAAFRNFYRVPDSGLWVAMSLRDPVKVRVAVLILKELGADPRSVALRF